MKETKKQIIKEMSDCDFQWSKLEISEDILKVAKEIYKMYKEELKNTSCSNARYIALKNAKENGLIKNFRTANNAISKGLYFGSKVGFDAMYSIEF